MASAVPIVFGSYNSSFEVVAYNCTALALVVALALALLAALIPASFVAFQASVVVYVPASFVAFQALVVVYVPASAVV